VPGKWGESSGSRELSSSLTKTSLRGLGWRDAAGSVDVVDNDALAARGLTFPYLASGPNDGAGVLLLHGFPQYSIEWAAQLEALGEAGYRAVAPDQRGYAPGNRPADVNAYRADELVADVLAMLDALGWERAHLVGHDWGGSVAWHLAARHPERVRSLTAVSTPHPRAFTAAIDSGGEQIAKSAYFATFREPGTGEDALLADDAAALREVLSGLPNADRYVERQRTGQTLTSALNWYRAMRRRDNEHTGVVTVPTLYVWGDADSAFSREAAEGTAEFVAAAYTFAPLAGAGHWIPETRAGELNHLLLAHLAGT
jgi:pimeloyl-ACP methyl ester carboxylesterase